LLSLVRGKEQGARGKRIDDKRRKRRDEAA
jgi:hypothetical protein